MVVMEKLSIENEAELLRIGGGVGRAKFSRKWKCLGKT
jgi:hypothetical protein